MFVKELAALDKAIEGAEADPELTGVAPKLRILRDVLEGLEAVYTLPCEGGPGCKCPLPEAHGLALIMTLGLFVSDKLREKAADNPLLVVETARRAEVYTSGFVAAVREHIDDALRPTQKEANA